MKALTHFRKANDNAGIVYMNDNTTFGYMVRCSLFETFIGILKNNAIHEYCPKTS